MAKHWRMLYSLAIDHDLHVPGLPPLSHSYPYHINRRLHRPIVSCSKSDEHVERRKNNVLAVQAHAMDRGSLATLDGDADIDRLPHQPISVWNVEQTMQASSID